MPPFVFDQSPLLVYWESTQACDLACAHCRASAICNRHPDELDTQESKDLLDELRRFGPRPPVVVITGGDPMRRPDLFDLIDHARSIGLPVALAPSVTPLLTAAALDRLFHAGVRTISLSLDGASAEVHDGIRGVPGCFDSTLEALRAARATGMQVQINTLVTAGTLAGLPDVYALLQDQGILRWSLFFLIHVGRGSTLEQIAPEEAEEVSYWLSHLMETAPFEVKATELPHFRRVALQRHLAGGGSMGSILSQPLGRGFGVRDGNGIMFISHTGEVFPSGFLPLSAGNVREMAATALYRHSPLFRKIRRPDGYSGKCGRCKYRHLCGGSRARACAASGDPLGSDPLCAYEPDGEAVV